MAFPGALPLACLVTAVLLGLWTEGPMRGRLLYDALVVGSALAAWFGGVNAGMLFTLGGWLAGSVLFLGPEPGFAWYKLGMSVTETLLLPLGIVTSVVFSALRDALRQSERRAERAETALLSAERLRSAAEPDTQAAASAPPLLAEGEHAHVLARGGVHVWSIETQAVRCLTFGTASAYNLQLFADIHADERPVLASHLRHVVQSRVPLEITVRGVSDNGAVLWYRIFGELVSGTAQGGGRIVGGRLDISHLYEQQRQLKAAKAEAEAASKAKSQFLASMSHEIRTPLAAILGFSEILLNPNHSTAERGKFVHIIQRNSELLSQIIDNVLDLSKIEAGRMEIECLPVNLPLLINDVMDALSYQVQAKGLTVICNIAESTPCDIKTDPTRVKQILINLLNNAIKFTERGSITVNVSAAASASTGSVVNRKAWMVTFEIKDTGVGCAIHWPLRN